jgi:hypothetical protein
MLGYSISPIGSQNEGEFRVVAVDSFVFSMNRLYFSINAFQSAKTMMKRWIFVALLACMAFLPKRSHAQLYVGIGLQAGYCKMPNADLPIDRYRSRGFFYKQMNHFRFPFGEIYSASYRPDRALFELSLNTRRMRATAKSTDAGGIYQKDIRFSIQSLSLGAGYAFVDAEKFALYLGVSADVGYARLLQRQGYTTQISRTPYGLFRRSPMLSGSLYAKMVFRDSRETISVWSLTPYIQLPFLTFDFQVLDQVLNSGYLTPIAYTLPARPVNVGLAFNFDLDLLGFLMK